MPSVLTGGFKFRPRLTEFETRLTPSTGVDAYVFVVPPAGTSPATTDNDHMGTPQWGDDPTNDDMGTADSVDTCNDDMFGVGGGDGSNDGEFGVGGSDNTANDPGFGVSGKPPAPSTGGPTPSGTTVVQGPGRIPYPEKSIAVVTDDTAKGDSAAIKRAGPPDINVVGNVNGGWEQVRRIVGGAASGSVGGLIISGHGSGNGGVGSGPMVGIGVSGCTGG